jgi:hypothetical protein
MSPRPRGTSRVETYAALRVRGVPHRLVTVSPIAVSAAEWAPISLKSLPEPFLALIAPSGTGAAGQVKFRLPPTTPPGSYQGTILVGGEERPIEIVVEPHTNLAVQPDSVTLIAQPGSQASVELSVLNHGNVLAEIRRGYALGFVDVHALDHGLDEAARATPGEGVKRVDVLFDELARGSGGVARLELEEGYGPLAPGDARSLRARFALPKELRPGHTYTARLRIEDAAFSIRAEIPRGSTGKEVAG